MFWLPDAFLMLFAAALAFSALLHEFEECHLGTVYAVSFNSTNYLTGYLPCTSTVAPSLAKRSAVCFPMPSVLPVTSTTLLWLAYYTFQLGKRLGSKQPSSSPVTSTVFPCSFPAMAATKALPDVS